MFLPFVPLQLFSKILISCLVSAVFAAPHPAPKAEASADANADPGHLQMEYYRDQVMTNKEETDDFEEICSVNQHLLRCQQALHPRRRGYNSGQVLLPVHFLLQLSTILVTTLLLV